MRKRLVVALAVLVMTLAAVPFGASAAAPNIAQVSATSWQDSLRREFNSLCSSGGVGSFAPSPSVQTTVAFSGTGSELGGTGTGTLDLAFDGSYFSMYGTVVVNGVEKVVEGYGQMFCVLPDYAIISGEFYISDYSEVTSAEPVDGIFGTMVGSVSDGVHQNQGSLSLTLRESDDVKR